MQHAGANKTVCIRFNPATLRTLAKLSSKTLLSRNNVIRYAIARLAEREEEISVPAEEKLYTYGKSC
jgi:predicted transcriptional regulator